MANTYEFSVSLGSAGSSSSNPSVVSTVTNSATAFAASQALANTASTDAATLSALVLLGSTVTSGMVTDMATVVTDIAAIQTAVSAFAQADFIFAVDTTNSPAVKDAVLAMKVIESFLISHTSLTGSGVIPDSTGTL